MKQNKIENSRLGVFTTLLLIGALLIKLVNTYLFENLLGDHVSFNYTEFLINYRGGFVRRGILGEPLYQLCLHTGISPFPVIIVFSIAIFAIVAVFFIRQFKMKDYSYWLLLCPLFYGHVMNIIRKDYLCYLLIICMLLILTTKKSDTMKFIAVSAISVFGLLCHEAFIFFGIPLIALYMLSVKELRYGGIFYSILSLATFGILSIYKGNYDVASAIIDSWNAILPADTQYDMQEAKSIGALAWDTTQTMKDHFTVNFHSDDGFGWMGLFLRPLFAVLVYYFATNFIFVMKRGNSDTEDIDTNNKTIESQTKTNLSMLFIFSMICLLPMFTVLSCDYARIYQYALITSFSMFLLIPSERITAMFPKFFRIMVERLNRWLESVIVPTKGMMLLLLLCLGVPNCFFNVANALTMSVAGTYFYSAAFVVEKLISIIM